MNIATAYDYLSSKGPVQAQTVPVNRWRKALTSRIFYHVAFWVMLFLLNAVSQGYQSGAPLNTIICFGIQLPFLLLVVYVNLYVLLPTYYYNGKMTPYLGSLLLCSMGINALNLLFFGMIMKLGLLPIALKPESQFTAFSFISKGFFMITVVGLSTGIKLSKDHFLQKQKAGLLEKEKLATELSLLKSQLQPHFFFNTLNNLYALTLKKSDLAPEVVLKLSDFMGYVLYETDQEKTSLIKEISYIQSYIDLETLRFGVKPEVIFEISGNCEQIMLPPLLLLPFIENSFKHSLNSGAMEVKIHIDLRVTATKLNMTVVNPSAEPAPNTKKGIGLRNVKRRLDLIYDRSYQLLQERTSNQFTTHLEIPLF